MEEAPLVSPVNLFLDEFRSPLVLILVASAVLLFLVTAIGDESERNIDAGLGFVQNLRAQRGMEALRRMATPVATLLRDDRVVSIPAHGRLLEAYDMRVEESALVGYARANACRCEVGRR